jgi:hypothetical protein
VKLRDLPFKQPQNFHQKQNRHLSATQSITDRNRTSLFKSQNMSSFLFRRAAGVSANAARTFSTTSPRNVARITVVGNLADTPELHQTSTGREVIRYAVASNSGPSSNRQTSWFRIATFTEAGPRRDFMLNLPKGYVELA